MVDVSDQKVVVSRPGAPICPIEKLNNFTAPSSSRNPKIAHIFYKMKFVEERGFGMEELSKLESYGLRRPHYEMDGQILKVTLYRDINPEKQTITMSQLPGLNILKQHKRLTTKEYEEISGLKERQARNHLKALVDNGYAKKEGTKYVLID